MRLGRWQNELLQRSCVRRDCATKPCTGPIENCKRYVSGMRRFLKWLEKAWYGDQGWQSTGDAGAG